MSLHIASRPVARRRVRTGHRVASTIASQPAASAPAFLYTCAECQLTSQPMLTRSEAIHLARVHDRLHHFGAPTALASDQFVCESCRVEPATTTWSHPRAGAPFALCGPCARIVTDAPPGRKQAGR